MIIFDKRCSIPLKNHILFPRVYTEQRSFYFVFECISCLNFVLISKTHRHVNAIKSYQHFEGTPLLHAP